MTWYASSDDTAIGVATQKLKTITGQRWRVEDKETNPAADLMKH